MEQVREIINQLQEKREESVNRIMTFSSENPEKRITNLRLKLEQCCSDITPGFIIDEFNEVVYNALFNYFLDIPDPNYDLNKGILILGDVGTGKTTIMRHFQRFLSFGSKNVFKIAESRLIVRDYLKSGIVGIEKWTFDLKAEGKHMNLCIDDLGLESEEAANYGQKIDVMGEVIADRYQLFIKFGIKTHAISNLGSDLKTKYDERISDRFREMFNIVKLTGISRRK